MFLIIVYSRQFLYFNFIKNLKIDKAIVVKFEGKVF
jgi:hypothetical protein